MKTLEELMRIHAERKQQRRNWDNVWDEIAYYVLPSKTGFNTTFVPGERQRWSRRFDSTAGQANKTLANHLHMALCSPSQPWFELYFRDEELNRSDPAKEWAEDSTNRMFSAFNYSNFNGVINTLFQNFCAFGTACLEVTEMKTPREPFSLRFMNIKLSDCCFDVNDYMEIDTIYHEYKITPRQAEMKFGDKFADMKRVEGKVELMQITFPNDNYDPTSLNPKKRSYVSQWVHSGEVFETEYFYEFPFMVPRFDVIDQDDIYGEGPALLSLSDIRSINSAKRLEFRAYEKGIDPPLMGATGGIIGDLHIEAGGYTQVRDPRMIGELPGQMKYEMVMNKGEELRDHIRKAYKIDELLVPERKGQNPATATEIQIRYEQMQKMMGATVGRIESELLKPLIDRVFGIMLRNGRFAPMPEELAGADMDVKYVGPLAKSQISHDAVAIERAIQASMGISQITQTPSKVLDFNKAERVLYDRYNTPAIVIRSEKEVEQMEAAERAEAAKQQQQQDAMASATVQQQQVDADAANVELLQNMRGM